MSGHTTPAETRLPIERSAFGRASVMHGYAKSIITPTSGFMSRDIDLFERFKTLRVNLTITTDSDDFRRRYQPRCPSIAARKAAAALSSASVRIGISISPMLPLKDAEAFGPRLADLRADEYVTQCLKPGGSRFAAGTSTEALRMVRENGWGVCEYREAHQRLARIPGRE